MGYSAKQFFPFVRQNNKAGKSTELACAASSRFKPVIICYIKKPKILQLRKYSIRARFELCTAISQQAMHAW